MTTAASKNLRHGDRVAWPDGTEGTVIEHGYHAVKVAWDDGQTGTLAHRDWPDGSRILRSVAP